MSYEELWRQLLQDALAAGELRSDLDADAACKFVLNALNWAPEWWDPERGSLDAVIGSAHVLFRCGLGVAATASR